MPSNLPEVQKENWATNEIVMPDDTNSWGRSINTLSKAVPLYSACGNVYTATYTNNVYNLTPLSFNDNTSNVTVDSYVDGMSVIFQCPTNNLANCSVNVNSLGTKTIKTIDNVNLPAGKLNSGYFVELKYDKTNDCFKFQQDFNKADRNFSNLTEEAEKHFLNKSQITNCILEAPNGVATYSGSTITIKAGLKVLIPNGRNADGTLNNIEFTVPSDTIVTRNITDTTLIHIFFDIDDDNNVSGHDTKNYMSIPSDISYTYNIGFYYREDENKFYYKNASGVISERKGFYIGCAVLESASTTSNVTKLYCPSVTKLVTQDQISGIWVRKPIRILNNITRTEALETQQIIKVDLSSYLPNDNNCYEVYITLNQATQNYGYARIDIEGSFGLYNIGCVTQVHTASRGDNNNTANVTIGLDRKLKLKWFAIASQPFITEAFIECYRKIAIY